MHKGCGLAACAPIVGCFVIVALLGLSIFTAANIMFKAKPAAGVPTLNLPWIDSTTATIPADIQEKIDDNWAEYVAASVVTLVDPRIIAALHYREASNNPEITLWDGTMRIADDPRCDWPENSGIRNLTTCSIRAANHIKSMAQGVYEVDITLINTKDSLQKGFLSYNRGYMYKNNGCTPDQSPYVMNQYDNGTYKDMIWPDNECEPPGTRGRQDSRPGAYPVFLILSQAGGYSDPGGGGGGFSGGEEEPGGSGGSGGGAD